MKKEIKKRTKRNKERSLLFLLFFSLYLFYNNIKYTTFIYSYIYYIINKSKLQKEEK